jgi:hypothetical protein
MICRLTEFGRVLQSRAEERQEKERFFVSCVLGLNVRPLLRIRCNLIRLSVCFSLSQVLLLSGTGFATVIRPLFNQLVG